MSHDIAVPPESADTDSVTDATGVASPMRRQILAIGTAVCGAAVAGAIFGIRPAQADIVKTVGKLLYLDPIVLNFAFEMEELEADFFSRITRIPVYASLSERERNVFNTIAAQDCGHFDKLNSVRDESGYKNSGHLESRNAESTPRPRTFTYPRLDNRDQLLKTAIDLKESVLFGYHGAVELVHNGALLGVAAAIAGTEGRHATALRELAGLDPVPAPFEGALGAQTAGRKLAKYGFAGGTTR